MSLQDQAIVHHGQFPDRVPKQSQRPHPQIGFSKTLRAHPRYSQKRFPYEYRASLFHRLLLLVFAATNRDQPQHPKHRAEEQAVHHQGGEFQQLQHREEYLIQLKFEQLEPREVGYQRRSDSMMQKIHPDLKPDWRRRHNDQTQFHMPFD